MIYFFFDSDVAFSAPFYLSIYYEAFIYVNACLQRGENMLVKDPTRHKFRPWYDLKNRIQPEKGWNSSEDCIPELGPGNHRKTGRTL